MLHKRLLNYLLSLSLTTTLAYAYPCHSTSTTACPTRLVYQYPKVGTWFENIAVRSNGDLLLTSLNNPGGLTTLSPFQRDPPRQLITPADLDYLNSTLGIVEAEPDTFYMLAGNFSLAAGAVGMQRGTNALFQVQFEDTNANCDEQPNVQLVKHFGPEVQFVNGLTKFNNTLLLAADSGLGAIWTIDVLTGDYHKLIEDDLLKPPNPQGSQFKEGVNGLHFTRHGSRSDGGIVYFTNSQKRIYGKISLDGNARVVGPVTIIAKSISEDGVEVQWDDFALDANGNAWVATEAGNSIQLVTREGQVKVVAGNVNSTDIAQPTSTAFGRTRWDREVLYVVTAGGLGFPIWEGGQAVRGGAQVVAVDTAKCRRWRK